jgi:hypothetical protein
VVEVSLVASKTAFTISLSSGGWLHQTPKFSNKGLRIVSQDEAFSKGIIVWKQGSTGFLLRLGVLICLIRHRPPPASTTTATQTHICFKTMRDPGLKENPILQ